MSVTATLKCKGCGKKIIYDPNAKDPEKCVECLYDKTPKQPKKKQGESELVAELLQQIKYERWPDPAREHLFAREIGRRWRFDLAWIDHRVAVEVDGGTWSRGRHTRGRGFEKDCEKVNEAARMGWIVIRVTSTMVNDGRALVEVENALRARRVI